VVIQNSYERIAQPPPEGKVKKGAKIDGLPVTETILEWSVVKGR
jgi:hypothetical protein